MENYSSYVAILLEIIEQLLATIKGKEGEGGSANFTDVANNICDYISNKYGIKLESSFSSYNEAKRAYGKIRNEYQIFGFDNYEHVDVDKVLADIKYTFEVYEFPNTRFSMQLISLIVKLLGSI